MKSELEVDIEPQESEEITEPRPRIVYTQAPVLLARLVERCEVGWRVVVGGR